MSQRNWYVIQCKAKESFRATENLQNQGYQVFHPTLTAEKLRGGKLVTVEEPLFPYYLFIHLSDVTDNWRPLRSTRGVLKLLTFGQQPVQVSEQLIVELKQRLLPEAESLFNQGDPVVIETGPFQGLEAIFSKKKGDERVFLLLNLLHQQQHLEVPLKAIRPL